MRWRNTRPCHVRGRDLSSAGSAASVSIHSAIKAPARLTKDSMASESSPTEPVICHATTLSVMVATAAAMDSQA